MCPDLTNCRPTTLKNYVSAIKDRCWFLHYLHLLRFNNRGDLTGHQRRIWTPATHLLNESTDIKQLRLESIARNVAECGFALAQGLISREDGY